MATQPPPALPVFYNDLIPLSSVDHAKYAIKGTEGAPYFANQHAIPLTVDEFIFAQRSFPIIFSDSDEPVPLALLGLNEGVNVFLDDQAKAITPFYVPAYVRRYPFMLARLRPDAQELSLCFDPTSELIGEHKDGNALFEDGKPTENLNGVLKFCEDFETAAQRTAQFVNEIKALDLLIDGEATIQLEEGQPPFVYRGFKMVDEAKLRALSGEDLQKINENGILALVTAHLFSLGLVQSIFAAQLTLGKVPGREAQPIPA